MVGVPRYTLKPYKDACHLLPQRATLPSKERKWSLSWNVTEDAEAVPIEHMRRSTIEPPLARCVFTPDVCAGCQLVCAVVPSSVASAGCAGARALSWVPVWSSSTPASVTSSWKALGTVPATPTGHTELLLMIVNELKASRMHGEGSPQTRVPRSPVRPGSCSLMSNGTGCASHQVEEVGDGSYRGGVHADPNRRPRVETCGGGCHFRSAPSAPDCVRAPVLPRRGELEMLGTGGATARKSCLAR